MQWVKCSLNMLQCHLKILFLKQWKNLSVSLTTCSFRLIRKIMNIMPVNYLSSISPIAPTKYLLLDIANSLDQIQNMMDVGAINQNNFNFNITNEKQLADMNEWLGRLSDSIASGQIPQNANIPVNQSTFVSDFYPTQQQQQQFNTQYPILDNNNMYSNNESDLYVRSQPLPQPVVPSQNIQSYLGMTYPQQPIAVGGMTGQRQHYTKVPNLSDQKFNPEVITAYNFTAGNKPPKEEVEAFKPTKTDSHNEKKNMATLINTFSSALVEPKKPTVVKSEPEETKKDENDTIRDLITSDLSKLSLEDTKTVEKDDTLYPTDNLKSLSPKSSKHYLLLKKMTEWVNENYRNSILCQ